MAERKRARDQKDVLRAKGDVTTSHGLQQWGDDPVGEGIGTGGSGTAERAAKLAEGQRRQLEGDDDIG